MTGYRRLSDRNHVVSLKTWPVGAALLHRAAVDLIPASGIWARAYRGTDGVLNPDARMSSFTLERPPEPILASTRIASIMNSTSPPITAQHTLSAYRLGVGFGTAGVVFYVGCFITMATVPRDKAIVFFNSLLHGLDVEPVLRDSVPAPEFLLGIVSTFILAWSTGVIVAGVYNCCARSAR